MAKKSNQDILEILLSIFLAAAASHALSGIADLYKSRWGIETGVRVKTYAFRPRTRSKDYRIRIFYFYFSILMYNLWIIADIYLWLEVSNKVGEKHLITAKYFRKQFSLFDPGG